MNLPPELTQARLKELLQYDPETGVFTRRIATGYRGRYKAGTVAGSLEKDSGYILIGVDGVQYRAHRLAWLYTHGSFPAHGIDHKDTIRSHNWLSNLRPATQSQNGQNLRTPKASNKSGFLGVCLSTPLGDKWKATIKVNGKYKFLGVFQTPEEASAAYLSAKRKYHPFQTLV